ncbi:MAG: hypothetical protein Q9Q13_12000 [Acidobacteriota bacterium]|nr:hypothetical protein [Acidobacteriota bacterium]
METLLGHKRPPAESGFSLAEVTVALGITTILFLAALSMLTMDHRLYNRDDAVLEAAREGRYAIDKLERDMLMLGYQVDVRTVADPGPDGTENTDDDLVGQPSIVYAAPYELVFNADIDPTIDAIQDGKTGDSVPSGYAPVTFHTGAETIRYTLDSNGDGDVDASDQGDDADEAVIDNDGLFLLQRETYGYNGTDNQNPAGPVALVRGPVAYPNGARAIPSLPLLGSLRLRPGRRPVGRRRQWRRDRRQRYPRAGRTGRPRPRHRRRCRQRCGSRHRRGPERQRDSRPSHLGHHHAGRDPRHLRDFLPGHDLRGPQAFLEHRALSLPLGDNEHRDQAAEHRSSGRRLRRRAGEDQFAEHRQRLFRPPGRRQGHLELEPVGGRRQFRG